MLTSSIWLSLTLCSILNGISLGQRLPPGYQQTTCSVLRQLALTSTCSISSSCCTRLECGVFIGTTAQLQILPCTTPPSINVQVLQGHFVLLNRTLQNSQEIRVPLLGAVHLGLEQTANYSSVIFSLSVGSTSIVPRTSIPIDRSQCDPRQPLDACPTETIPTIDPNSPALSTCESLQSLASRLGTCAVDEDCSLLHCTFLNQYPADLSIEPCEDPPSVTVVVRESDEGAVLVNETLTESRTQSVTVGNQHLFDLTVLIEHRDHPDIIVITVLASPTVVPTNITLIPRTVIPLDRSNCTNNITGIHTDDIPLPPTASTTDSATCRSLKQLSGTIQGACNTNPICNSVLCDFSLLGLFYLLEFTVLPCLEVPGIQLVLINSLDGSVVLNRTLTKSGLDYIMVGESELTLNETVIQSPDQSSLIVQVDVLLPSPLPSVPLLPRTTIPLDRCDCPEINCDGSDKTPTNLLPLTTMTSTTSSPVKGTETSSQHSLLQIALPVGIVGGVLVVAVTVLLVAALVYFVYIKRKNQAYGFQRMSFEEVKQED